MRLIETKEDLFVALADSYDSVILILKTSNICGQSKRAYEKFKDLEKKYKEIESQMFVLVVQDAKGVSDYISETFGIVHESPQAIVIRNEDVIYYEDHAKIDIEKTTHLLKEKTPANGNYEET
ncbi:MAG: bacillithiol system redox-active protein YtxJ [Candidatus Campbellbacteria bacterium]|nr:bacillithiol system redox-active protein YtxJ [Candidatus Campbellbacteria bacterium]